MRRELNVLSPAVTRLVVKKERIQLHVFFQDSDATEGEFTVAVVIEEDEGKLSNLL